MRQRAATGRLRALAFDVCARMQAAQPVPPLGEAPIIITGLWRSGTTLLHELLASIDGLTAPTNWQCLRPSSFRLVRPGRDATALRPMDGLPVSTFSPQEDEFALLLMGAPSLYRGFLDPRRLPELEALLDKPDDTEFLEPWLRFLADVAAERPGRLLLKSPNHLFRLGAIRATFPDAPIILLLRDPNEVYWSNCRMWAEMVTLHGHWPASPDGIGGFVVAALKAAAVVLDALARAPPAGMRVCRFDRLIENPVEETRRLSTALGLSSSGKRRLADATSARSEHVPSTRRAAASPCAQAVIEQLRQANQRLMEATSL